MELAKVGNASSRRPHPKLTPGNLIDDVGRSAHHVSGDGQGELPRSHSGLPGLMFTSTKAIALSSTILSGISMFFCLLILLAAAWVYSVGPARREISRVSFRLMLWSMFFGIGYDLCYILLYPNVRGFTSLTEIV